MKKREYVQVGDYLLPNLKADKIHLDLFGRAKLEYLKKYAYRLYFKLLVQNELIDYLLKYQKEVDDLYEKMVKEYKIKWNVTEELKQNDQMKWVQMMNNIKICVDEIVYKTLLN